MFSTKEQLEKRTPKGGIKREDYINLLASEFYETASADAKEQVTANLANFAYDPINYDFLRKSNVPDLFLYLIVSGNEKLTLHGIAGICNLCLDEQSKEIFIQTENIEQISNLLTHTNLEISLNALTTLVFLINEETKSKICCTDNLITILNLSESDNDRLKLLATLFLEDYCTKEEIDLIKK